jgi:hypothetical protein
VIAAIRDKGAQLPAERQERSVTSDA